MAKWLLIDGFNLAYAVTPATFEDVVSYIVPELQKRDAYPRAYRSGTLREKLFGGHARLDAPHPAAKFRDIKAYKAASQTHLEEKNQELLKRLTF